MFPEYRDLITKLKGHDAHFTRLFDKHNELDQAIKNMESRLVAATEVEIETKKKEKLLLKDQLYAHLKKVEASAP
ncbi:MAG: YdcH family protein [Hydrogenophaga sp.]|nr:YdcH family protein [Hydrogenophaga sp.]